MAQNDRAHLYVQEAAVTVARLSIVVVCPLRFFSQPVGEQTAQNHVCLRRPGRRRPKAEEVNDPPQTITVTSCRFRTVVRHAIPSGATPPSVYRLQSCIDPNQRRDQLSAIKIGKCAYSQV
jgi:hypothetical protein